MGKFILNLMNPANTYPRTGRHRNSQTETLKSSKSCCLLTKYIRRISPSVTATDDLFVCYLKQYLPIRKCQKNILKHCNGHSNAQATK